MINMDLPSFPDASSIFKAPILINRTALPDLHQYLSPARAMQLQSYGHQVQMQATSYPHPLKNLHPIGSHHFTGGLNSGSRFSNFHSNGEQNCRHLWTHNAAPDFYHGSMRILSDEDTAVTDISGFHGVENTINQHHDMQLDIDEMSYEELLALEEWIGDVKTGLTEEYINIKLKTSAHNSRTTCLPSDKSLRFSRGSEACIICQVGYEEDEIIGTLYCGHNYHGECIKQWLLVKNLCPICKKTALAKDDTQG